MINNYLLDHNKYMKKFFKDNYLLIIFLLILSVISLFNMLNAKLISPTYNKAFIKQLIWFIIGFIILLLCQKLKFKKLFKYSFYFYLFTIILLILVLFLGSDVNGAKCWLNIFGITFQPSELAKLSLSLYLVSIATNTKLKTFKDELKIILKLLFLTLIPSILVFLEPDTGAIINFLIILFVVILSLKLNKWWYITGFGLLILGISSFFVLYFFFQDTLIKLIGTSFFYRMDRLINFAQGNSYQLENALITIGASSFFGVGLNKILLYIPEAPTDFFFAFSIGNYGVFSAIIICLSFITIDLFLIYKINKNKSKSIKTFAYTYIAIFIFHQIYNISMNLGLLPIMGIPLPFLSYGGTNTLINFLFLGIILNLLTKKETI